MLIGFVVLYLMFSVGVGLYASRRAHNSRDVVVAGRNLAMPIVTATLLAPAAMFTENILKHIALKEMNDQQMLKTMRIILVTLSGFVLWFALSSESSIFHMVEDAYKVTLVGAFVPFAFGLYWKRASNQGALLSIVLGIGSWLLMELIQPDTYWPAQLVGLLFSISGMLIGSMLPNKLRDRHHARA